MDDLMNKIQNVLNDEESMKQIKELADMLTADNGGQGEQDVQSEAPQSPQNMDFSQLLQSLGGVSPPAERRKSGENRQAHKNIQAFCGLSRTERKRTSGR